MPYRTLAVLTVSALAWTPSAAAAPTGARRMCTITDPRIDESSGLAMSRKHPGIVYTFNDSGGTPRIFALGPDCRTRAALTLGGARNRDWEAMAVTADGIYVGDIGDNLNGAWPYVVIYRIPEPQVLRTRTLRATAYRVTYADGPRNAETMMINPRTGRLYIASKEFGGSLYEARGRLHTGRPNVVHRIGDAPLYATDGAFAPDGRTYVIRTYWDARLYSASGKELAGMPLPRQQQGEGITYAAGGTSVLLSSEGRNQPLWQVPVPGRARPSPAAKPSAPGPAPGNGNGNGKLLGLLVVGGVALAGVAMFARRRRS
jgi:hypothetical protein